MTNPTTEIDLAERAQFYRVCPRTIRRWVTAGVDVNDSLAVAHHIVLQRKNPRTETLEVILAELDADTAELTEEDFSNAK
ncbi:MAG: hypothetical protein ORN51_12050 [Akkermansiaceae bacterium]|nr:hypothetical protein [Akkermansiaceae bacterium]